MDIRENKQVIMDGKMIHTWDEVKSAYSKRMETYGPSSKGLFYRHIPQDLPTPPKFYIRS
ncbi:hypothetical protein [Desulfonema magnum]|uniref:Uncharacterized protein n=1 Tax=Desulfonema magnum TaxID=45655 RepID=A0A975GLW1_9BACT|nr:hypothetical protein [Desulfonema magnum]QTA86276.1 Uncharacterized protein dnm_022970 [Desulfonema magnum]